MLPQHAMSGPSSAARTRATAGRLIFGAAMSGAGLLAADPELLMILTLSAGTPSSQTLVMVLNASGNTLVWSGGSAGASAKALL